VIPPISLAPKHVDTIREYTRRIAIELKVVGLMNIQYAIFENTVYVLEANPRASRTVPIVSKVCGISMARLATQAMLGKPIADMNLKQQQIPHYGVKESVFPFNMFPEVDPVLGPEMRSTEKCSDCRILSAWHSIKPGGYSKSAADGRYRTFHYCGAGQIGCAGACSSFQGAGVYDHGHRGNASIFQRARYRDRLCLQARQGSPGSGRRHQKRKNSSSGQHAERRQKFT